MKAQFCSQCGNRLAPAVVDGKACDQCPDCVHVAWRNPLPVGLALIEHRDQLVLIRRSRPPLADYWAPPAGYVECGESVPQGVAREAFEECGLEIAIDDLAGVFSQEDVNVIAIAYRAHSVGGELRAGDDAADVRTVTRGSMPPQAPPAAGDALDHWFYEVVRSTTAAWC